MHFLIVLYAFCVYLRRFTLSQTLPKNQRVGTTSELISQGRHYPDSKARQGLYKKGKLQANIPDEIDTKILNKIQTS